MVGIKINKTLRNVLIAVAAVVLIFAISSLLPEKDFHEKYENVDFSSLQATVNTTKSYSEYLAEHSNAGSAKSTVTIDIQDFDEENSFGVHSEMNYKGKDVVVTEEDSSITWNFEVQESGFYNISLEYIAVPSRNVTMERILYINGSIPFSGAETLAFYRLWKDGGPIKSDNQGNNIRPSQIEFFEYQTALFKSDLGYEVEPYRFYFEAGENSITLTSSNEPMAISKCQLVPVLTYDTYAQYLAKQPSNPDSYTGTPEPIKIQGENSVARSDPSLFARYDRSSATTEPYSVKNTILNYTGGDSWKSPGQWIE